MKKNTRFFGFFLSLVMALTFVPALRSTAYAAYCTDTFDLTLAQQYAEKWSLSVNYDEYVKQAGDCCNFVAQILIEAGIPENRYFHCSKAYSSSQTVSTYNIPSLIQYFRSMYDIPYYNTSRSLSVGKISADEYMRGSGNYNNKTRSACDGHSFTINDIAPGDCVTISNNSSYGRDHIVYVLSVDINSGLVHYAAHNRDAYDETYGIGLVKGVLKTSYLAAKPTPKPSNGFVYGDLDTDGKVTISDVSKLQLVLKGLTEVDFNMRAADVDLDNALSDNDKKIMQRNIADMTSLPYIDDYKCYYIKSAYGYVMDVEGGCTDSETNVGAYGFHGASNQAFLLVPVVSTFDMSKRYYRIIPMCDPTFKMCLNVWGGESDGNIQLYEFSGTENELWTLERYSDGYRIKSYLGGCITVEGGYDGANIRLADAGYGDDQKWYLEEVDPSDIGNVGTSYYDDEDEDYGYIDYDYEYYDDEDDEDLKTPDEFSFSQAGVEFLASLEGFSQYCYYDTYQSSIGYGTKCNGCSGQPHSSGQHYITREDAMNALKNQVSSRYAPIVRRQTKGIYMSQTQFDVLVCLCYNTGGGNDILSNSPLVKYLKGELTEEEARAAYSGYYVRSGGKRLQGLVNRRNKEADKFFEDAE